MRFYSLVGGAAFLITLLPACAVDLLGDTDATPSSNAVPDSEPTCVPMAAGESCALACDCLSGVCLNTICEAPRCDDRVLNAKETDVDCGGSCEPCEAEAACLVDADCVSGNCTEEACAFAQCTDGIANGDESDIDCGGSCEPCLEPGLACSTDDDCVEARCVDDRCQGPTCDDGIQNGEEADLDCGGAACPPCVAGERCREDEECTTLSCVDDRCDDALTYPDATHSASECVDAGGVVVRVELPESEGEATLCRLDAADGEQITCPLGWTQADLWSATEGCSSMDANYFRGPKEVICNIPDMEISEYCSNAACVDGQNVLVVEGHPFSNAEVERERQVRNGGPDNGQALVVWMGSSFEIVDTCSETCGTGGATGVLDVSARVVSIGCR